MKDKLAPTSCKYLQPLSDSLRDSVIRTARRTPGSSLKDYETQLDIERMLRYRLSRLQAELCKHDVAAAVLFSSVNMRYATGTRCLQVLNMHSPFRSVFVPAEGKSVLFDWPLLYDSATIPSTIREVRDAHSRIFTYYSAGDRSSEIANSWANEIRQLVVECTGETIRAKIAVDLTEPVAMNALLASELDVISAEELMEHACSIKSPEEITCMMQSVSIAEAGLARIREALRPGISENELLAILQHTNTAAGGEWLEYGVVVSGGRTNPAGREATDRIVRAGELVWIDTGMIGPFGYGADISRTFHCGPGQPTNQQISLYRTALEQLLHNIELIQPGITFKDLSDRSWPIPEEFRANRYPILAHGIGMGDEWPFIAFPIDWQNVGYDGILEKNMTLCIESFIGREDGIEGVKLEQMVVVTDSGYELISTFPFEETLLG